MSIQDLIVNYSVATSRTYPEDADTALQWLQTELGEAHEILLTRKGTWRRRNPDDHPTEFNLDDLGYELADIVMMAIVAGIAEGINVEEYLRAKLTRKMEEL